VLFRARHPRRPRAEAHGSAFEAAARRALAAAGSESELPEIQAWRRVFARLGLKPTQ
jgi:DNA/RNA-binding domain of Phe-tRNA-synthetase-like protein